MLDILSAIILGAVQGLSEFLPISSSGHLALIPHLLGVETGLAFDTVLH
ncbi:MAG TPA: undecaprenyl-diphosphatase, partial [Methanosphaera sp.]|nr:undecaprenyl-diphosphatase [Methanosphaera sp.]